MTVSFQNKDSAAATLTDIIGHTDTNQIVLISPFWKLDDNELNRLKDVGDNGKKITIVMADKKKKWKDENRANTIKQLREVKGIVIKEAHNLHTKCYYNDYRMLITSMNFYKESKFHNYEMGVTFLKNQEPTLFKKAKDEAELIIKYATPISDRIESIPQKKMERKKSNYNPSSKKYKIYHKKKTPQTKNGTTKRGKKSNYSSSKKYIPYHKNGTTKRGKKSF
ncbi:MAG: phospholipase D-like domain-containing protein [Candidatus Hydrothermarchaeales archaeon]